MDNALRASCGSDLVMVAKKVTQISEACPPTTTLLAEEVFDMDGKHSGINIALPNI